MNKKLIMMVLIIVLSIAFVVLAIDCRLKTVHYTVENEKSDVPMRIALITDLHSCLYGGKDQSDLIEAVRAQNPDVVLFGGDIFDDNMSAEGAAQALSAFGKEFNCYYVTGNHEIRRRNVSEIKEIVEGYGVKVLDGDHTKMAISSVSGMPDIYGFDDTTYYPSLQKQLDHMDKVTDNFYFEESFNVLLIHRPEHIEYWKSRGFDLVLCGHTHGGQWRIPGILNGLYAPQQGLFPEYAGGLYELDKTTLIVSRGLAKESNFVPRIFNRPELVIVDIV